MHAKDWKLKKIKNEKKKQEPSSQQAWHQEPPPRSTTFGNNNLHDRDRNRDRLMESLVSIILDRQTEGRSRPAEVVFKANQQLTISSKSPGLSSATAHELSDSKTPSCGARVRVRVGSEIEDTDSE